MPHPLPHALSHPRPHTPPRWQPAPARTGPTAERTTACRPPRHCAWALACAVVSLGSGCASVMRVDSEVTTHPHWPTGAPTGAAATYVFERLPSQTQGQTASAQAELEGLARSVLASKGWQLAPSTALSTATDEATSMAPDKASDSAAGAPWRVQVAASQTTLPRAPWEEPPTHGGWPRLALNASNSGWGLGLGWGGLRGDMPYHLRSVSVVVRDGTSGRVAYETRADHDGRWNSTPAVWQAMLAAALTGFPQPATVQQHIHIDMPR